MPSLSKTILLGLSGPSCSGKTTLSRLLRDALAPHAFILHEDDFYVTDALIPIKKASDGRELQDWDCLESIDAQGLKEMLEHVKGSGKVKEGFESKEDQNAVGEVRVDRNVLEEWRDMFREILGDENREGVRICIMDGFLLFAESMAEIRDLFDIRLLLRADYQTVKSRREARKGYVTLEGFWEDPENYVDEIVWPNYVADHAFLFEGGNVEGVPDDRVVGKLGIKVASRESSRDMTACFVWAAEIVEEAIRQVEENER